MRALLSVVVAAGIVAGGCTGAQPATATPSVPASGPTRHASPMPSPVESSSPSVLPSLPSLPQGTVVAGVSGALASQTEWLSAQQLGDESNSGTVLVLESPQSIAVFDTEAGVLASEIPRPSVQINEILVTADSIWVADHDGGAILRLDPDSGETVARVPIAGQAVSLTETNEGIWGGSGHVFPAHVSLIDPASNEIVRKIEAGAFPAYGLGSLWFGRDQNEITSRVRRIDPLSGDVLATIPMVGSQQGCYVDGTFAEAVWSWCFDPWVDSTPVRLDLDANKTVATVALESGGGLLGVTERSSWFFADADADLPNRLIRVNNSTNEIDAVYANEYVLTVGAGQLWMLDRAKGQLRSVDLDDL